MCIRDSHIIDLGPEAGLNGGQITAQGNLKDIINTDNSITGNYLSGKKYIHLPRKRRTAKNGRYLEILGATGNNLQNANLKIPTGTFTCVTGVSGSGKSTLVLQTLYNALNLSLNKNKSRLETWVGELYLELHRGTLTTHGLVKKQNRKLVHLLFNL